MYETNQYMKKCVLGSIAVCNKMRFKNVTPDPVQEVIVSDIV